MAERAASAIQSKAKSRRYSALILLFSLLFAASIYGLPESVNSEEPVPLQSIVVFREETEKLAPLTPSQLTITQWPADAIPVGSYSSLGEVFSEEGDYQSLKHRFFGEPLLRQQVARGDDRQIARLIPEGKRGLRVNVNRNTVLARALFPGARVDLLVTLRPSMEQPFTSHTVLQDVEVVSVNGYTSLATYPGLEEGDDRGALMMISVTPEEAERFSAVQYQGALDISIRPLEDRSLIASAGKSVGQLLGVEEAPLPEESAAARRERRAEERELKRDLRRERRRGRRRTRRRRR